MLDIPHTDSTSVRRRGQRLSPVLSDGAGWQGFALVVLGWSGVALAYGFAGMSTDPGSGGAVLGAAGMSVASFVLVARGIVVACAAARSPLRRVFQSRALFGTGATLVTIAVVAITALVVRAPWDGLGARGRPLADLINELTFTAAAAVCLVGGVVAARAGWIVRREERKWGAQARVCHPE